MLQPMEWENGVLKLLDQTKLPLKVEMIHCRDYQTVVRAIKTMQVRGAPAIGVAAAFGLVLGAQQINTESRQEFIRELEKIAECLRQTRPTAVNLFWAIEQMMQLVYTHQSLSVAEVKQVMLREAQRLAKEDLMNNRKIGAFGAALIEDGDSILTHCNAGALATVGFGTALGVIRAAHNAGKKIKVFADETRPLLQGARLTTWELMQENIPVTLITDNMASWVMRRRMVNKVIVGADRIAANGDVANKIGTYGLAVLARHHKLSFYVAAPLSTVDLTLSTGKEIPIEERSFDEVTHVYGQQVAPSDVKVFNPAFDVTPHELVTAIITERGIVLPPFDENLRKLKQA